MRTLYIGLNPPASTDKRHITHCPFIQIELRRTADVLKACRNTQQYTHLLLTSQTAARLFLDLTSDVPLAMAVYSVGRATTRYLIDRGVSVLRTAHEESAEGVVEMLKGEDLQNAHLFWPHSTQARPVIAKALLNDQTKLTECLLYDTLLSRPVLLPNLQDYDEVYFTSPSTVDAFFTFYGDIPKSLALTPIGPVTAMRLTDWLQKDNKDTNDLKD